MGVTTVSNSLILGGWVTKVLNNGDKKWGHSDFAFDSVNCVIINFSPRHNVLCFSFVVVFYSMYGLYAIIKVVFLNERDCHV